MSPLRPADAREGLRPGGLDFRPTYDLGRDGVMRSTEQSHCRLGIASIDILLIHDVDVFTHGSEQAADQRYREALEGAYPALDELRRQGIIKALGVGLNNVAPCLRFARGTDIDCILLAGRYTLLEQGALDELLPLCERKGIGIMLGGPFNSGILVTGPVDGAKFDYRDAPPEVLERARRIDGVCRRHGVAMATAALQFPLAHPAVASIIPGAMSRTEVLENVERMRAVIPADLWAELRNEGLLHEAAPVPSTG
jgi:D-threo-aldose 1-dehydrogenase